MASRRSKIKRSAELPPDQASYTRLDDSSNGNRLTQTGTQTATYTVSSTNNRISSISGTPTRSYTYDASGNVIDDGTIAFTYSDAGRMISATAASVTTTYVHSALGQRVKKSNTADTRLFMYDEAGHLLGEYDATGALVQETVWLGDIPVATLRPGGGGVSVFYVHTDHLNTPRRITRPGDNAILWRWDSDPFGVGAANEDPDGDTMLFTYGLRFPGQYHDVESGLSYNYFRDYDAQTGRYLQSDPIGLEAGINTYLYGDAAPLTYIDPYGQDAAAGALPLPRPLPGWVRPVGVVGAGWLGWEIGSVAYPHIAVPLGNVVDSMCRTKDESKECDKEWADAFRECKKMLSGGNPPRGVTGGYTNVYDCARGLVSERCGGNPVGAGDAAGPRQKGGRWRGKR